MYVQHNNKYLTMKNAVQSKDCEMLNDLLTRGAK
jgi:hypothetical protein